MAAQVQAEDSLQVCIEAGWSVLFVSDAGQRYVTLPWFFSSKRERAEGSH